MSVKFTDAAQIGHVKTTSDGYLAAYAKAVRSGIQVYTKDEMGLAGGGTVNVYRPPEEVFSKDSLRSFSHAPVTVGHPAEMVDANNWKDLAVGEVSTEALRDGEFVALPLILKDKSAIDAINGGMKELSAGYTAEIEFEDGVAEDGTAYQAVMRNIRINHLALVDKARAGSDARIGDSQSWGIKPVAKEETKMTVELKTVILGDRAVKVEASDADAVAVILKDHKTALDAKDKEIGSLTTKLVDAESKVLSDEDLQKLIDAKVELKAKRDAVKAKIGDKADAMTDGQIDGAFLALDGFESVSDAGRDAIKGKKKVEDSETRVNAALAKFLNPEIK